ncbi:MAG: preprotein translocase subunit YajC [Acidimicrobiia bacterium]
MLASAILAQDDSGGGGGAAFQLVFFLIIGLAMYFLLIRPQRRRVRDAQQLLSTLADGDEVITTGGMYGFINAIDGDTIWLDIAENVEIRVHRSAISRKIDAAKEPAGGQPTDDDEADEPDDEN